MGVDTCYHIGPYIKIKKINGSYKENVLKCSVKECKNYMKEIETGEFCQKCGTSLETYSKKIKEKQGFDNWENRFPLLKNLVNNSNMGSEQDEDIVMSNIRLFNNKKEYDRRNIEYGGEFDVTSISMEEEINIFKEKFKKHIESMIQFFGEGNISLHWGFVIHFN